MTSNCLHLRNIYFTHNNLGGKKRMTRSATYTHTFSFIIYLWISGVFFFLLLLFSGDFPTETGGWITGRQKVTMFFDDVMKWKSSCLIVLKMRTEPSLGCICLVAGKWAVRKVLTRLVAPASTWSWGNYFRAFGRSMSIWSISWTVNHRANQLCTHGFKLEKKKSRYDVIAISYHQDAVFFFSSG